jgi:hypothetical protein
MDVPACSFGGQPLLFPKTINNALLGNGVQPPGRANSYTCPIGETPGVGFLYMSRGSLGQLSGNSGAYALKFGLGFQAQVFPTLYFARAQRLYVPGTASQDANSPYLVEIADRRWILSRKHADLRYNVRLPKTSKYAYIQNTCNDPSSQTPWTWQQVITDLWNRLNIGTLTWPNPTPTLTSTPQDLRYENCSLWHALNDACRRVGLAVRYKPIEDVFDLVQMGIGASDPYAQQAFDFQNQGGTAQEFGIQSGATKRTQGDYVLADGEIIVGTDTVPGSVVVAFPSSFGDQAQLLAYGRYTYVTVAVNTLGLGNKYAPQSNALEDLIHDSMPAQYSTTGINFAVLPLRVNPTPTNLSDLQQRAKERAIDYVRSLIDDCDASITKAGPWKLAPGPTITEVVWHDYGDERGLCTTINRAPLKQDADEFAQHEHVRPFIVCVLNEDLQRYGQAEATVLSQHPADNPDPAGQFGTGETVTIHDVLPISCNTVYKISFQGAINGGTWGLSVNGVATAPMPWNIDNSDLNDDVTALSSVGDRNAYVYGGPVPSDIFIEFVGSLSNATVNVTVDGSGLTISGGGSATVTATALTKGNTIPTGTVIFSRWWEAQLFYVYDGSSCA